MKPRVNCIICKEKIWRRGSYKDGMQEKINRNREHRKDSDVTCSRKCARIFRRVEHYVVCRDNAYLKQKNKNI